MSVSKLSSCEAIRPLLSSYVDGEASESETSLVKSHIVQCGACVSYLAFLRLTDTVLSETPDVFPPASLSERIALATYARPTFGERLRTWFVPAPVRFGVVGGVLATGIVAVLVLQNPLSDSPPVRVANNDSQTAPAKPTQKENAPAEQDNSQPTDNAPVPKIEPVKPKRPVVVASIAKAVEKAADRTRDSASVPKVIVPSVKIDNTPKLATKTVKPSVKPSVLPVPRETVAITRPVPKPIRPASLVAPPATKTDNHMATAESKHNPVVSEAVTPKPEPVAPVKPQPDPNALVAVTEGREDGGSLSSRLGNVGKAASVKGSVPPNAVKQNDSLVASNGLTLVSAPVKN